MMWRMTRREWLSRSIQFAAAASVPGLLSSGCAKAAPNRDKSTVTVLYPTHDLGPDLDLGAKMLVFMPLVAWNRRGELEGRLAEQWEYSQDLRSCTIRLRDGIRWHDGMPVTADDMKFTLDLLTNPDAGQNAPGSYTVDVIDDRAYTVTYRQQDVTDGGALDDLLVCWPKHLLKDLDPKDINNWPFWSQPVGNGPYRHVRTVPDVMMEFEANPEYVFGPPRIPRVVLKLVPFGGFSAVAELLRENVDATAFSARSDVANVSRNPRFRVYEQGGWAANSIWWNLSNELFSDATVRQALTRAIDRRELLQVLNYPADTRPMDFLVTPRQRRRGEFPTATPHDPRRASDLLDSAGWSARDRHGLRMRGGKPFRFEMIVANMNWMGTTEAAVYVQDQLKRIGIHIDIVIMDGSALKPRMESGAFEAVLTGFGLSALGKQLRIGGYDNPLFFRILDQSRTTFDVNARDNLYNELTRIFQKDVPVTFLHPLANTTIASTRIRGLDGSPYRDDLTQCMDELWLERQA